MKDVKYSPEGLNDLCDVMCGKPEEPVYIDGGFVKCPVFTCEREREEALYKMCVETDTLSERCVEELMSAGFLTAPASTRYHGSYKGGLFDHSYTMATILQALTNKLGLKWEDKHSPIRVGILHDLCKIDQYKHIEGTNESFEYNNNTLLTGHGIKSVVLSQSLPDVDLTREEIACITYHMGAFTDKGEWNSYTNSVHSYPNVLWSHTADMYAAHVIELEV